MNFRFGRVDGDDAEALPFEPRGDAEAGARGVVGDADDGDGAGFFEDLGEGGVGDDDSSSSIFISFLKRATSGFVSVR